MSSWRSNLDARPIVVAIAGSNGAGKTTFYENFFDESALHFVNADSLAARNKIGPYEASSLASSFRSRMVEAGDSFIFETVFSDPVGDKLNFLKSLPESGYHVVLCFIGISNSRTSAQRVAMRISKGGHDVPVEKLRERFPRTLANFKAAIKTLPLVLTFDNDNLRDPFRFVAAYSKGRMIESHPPIPPWLARVAP